MEAERNYQQAMDDEAYREQEQIDAANYAQYMAQQAEQERESKKQYPIGEGWEG